MGFIKVIHAPSRCVAWGYNEFCSQRASVTPASDCTCGRVVQSPDPTRPGPHRGHSDCHMPVLEFFTLKSLSHAARLPLDMLAAWFASRLASATVIWILAMRIWDRIRSRRFRQARASFSDRDRRCRMVLSSLAQEAEPGRTDPRDGGYPAQGSFALSASP